MNERIQELMKQSMVEHQFDIRFSPEKFAELIIRECTGLIDSMDHSSQYFPHVADTIKQHFGVEE